MRIEINRQTSNYVTFVTHLLLVYHKFIVIVVIHKIYDLNENETFNISCSR